jgi:hypothetical protein
MRRARTFGLGGLALVAVAVTLTIGAATGTAQGPVNHGISFTKGCASPTQVGQPYSCTYTIRNGVDDAQDTLSITGIEDTVLSAGGPVSSGNVFGQLRFVAAEGTPTCTGGTGTGTPADPFINATSCLLPFGSRLNVLPFAFYTVTAADFNLPGHVLSDAADLTWHDLCNDPAGTDNTNCSPNPPPVGAGSQTIITGLPSTTATEIHNGNVHTPVLTVAAGSTVHDQATVSGGPGNPVPTGNVTFDWFTNNTCTGAPAATSAAFALVAGTVDATTFPQGPLAAGGYGFRAHYAGDNLYEASDGPCEPLSVVDARISITPNGTNVVGDPHEFTAKVEVNSGTGFVNAPAGTQVTFTIDSGPGSPNPPTSCMTVGATGSCTTTITSLVPGTTVVSAHTTVSVSGVSLTRHTDGTGGSSGPATKIWIAPQAAVRTDIHNPTHGVILSAQPGDVVHDKVFVTKAPGTPAATPAPTGQVTFHRYATINCTGPSVDETVALLPDGTAETSTFTVTADMSYRAHYLGDALYAPAMGPCEPLTVQTSICPQCPPPPCPAFPVFPGQGGPGGPCSFNVLESEIKGTVVEVTIQNSTSGGDAAMTGLTLVWPAANGALKSVVLDGYVYTGPPLTGGSATLTLAQLTPSAAARTIKVGQSEKLRLIFEKPASTNKAQYTGSVSFGNCTVAILP